VIAIANPVHAQEKSTPQAFVPGEIVIKFAAGSRASELAASASGKSDQPNAPLSSYIESLARETGVPFKVKQLGSGGNLIVEIQRDELISRLLNHLRAIPNIKEAKSLSGRTVPPGSQTLVQVVFLPNSCEADAVARIAGSGRTTGSELKPIVEKLQRETGISLRAQVDPSRTLAITPDLDVLTIDLAARLARLVDVEYAQPNFIRGRINRAVQNP
jgi:hypothetical protein